MRHSNEWPSIVRIYAKNMTHTIVALSVEFNPARCYGRISTNMMRTAGLFVCWRACPAWVLEAIVSWVVIETFLVKTFDGVVLAWAYTVWETGNI